MHQWEELQSRDDIVSRPNCNLRFVSRTRSVSLRLFVSQFRTGHTFALPLRITVAPHDVSCSLRQSVSQLQLAREMRLPPCPSQRSSPRPHSRNRAPAPPARADAASRQATRAAGTPTTASSGTSSGSMRNGVIAIRRDGTLALMNDEAYRIFGAASRGRRDIGRPFTDVLRDRARRRPRARRRVRADAPAQPRRAAAEGPTASSATRCRRSATTRGATIGAALFFKDLTRVEQLEERERLRDRLASLGEMAAGIAHELKNPLAGIEVMAGLLRARCPTRRTRSRCSPTSSAKRSWPTPSSSRCSSSCGRSGCRSSTPTLADVLQRGDHAGREPRRRAATSTCDVDVPEALPLIAGRPAPAVAGVHQPADQRVRGAGRQRARRDHGARLLPVEDEPASAATHAPTPTVRRRRRRQRPGRPAGSRPIGSSTRSSRPSRRAPGSAWRSCGRSSTRTTGGSTSSSAPGSGTRFRVTLPVDVSGSDRSWFE